MDWFKSVPFFTRYWFAGTIIFTLLGRFGILNPMNLIFLWEPITRFQIWRFFTCVLYYPLSPATGFHFLINLYFLYKYSGYLESGFYAANPADYFFMLVVNWICCLLIACFVNLPFLMDPMVLSVLYVWCQLNKDVIVNFWFGTRFKAMYLPWVLLGFNVVVNGGGLVEIIGILVGHFYYYLFFLYPDYSNMRLLSTPAIFKQWFPSQAGGIHGFGVPPVRPATAAPPPTRGRSWGAGHRLGTD